MDRRTRRTCIGHVLAIWLVACAAASAGESGVPEAADGGGLYRAECAPCHGPTAHGDGPQAWLFSPRPPNLRIASLDRHDPDALVRRIVDGVTESVDLGPRVLRAGAERTEALAKYVATLPRVDWELTERGRFVYVGRCERCHGVFGDRDPGRAGGTRLGDLHPNDAQVTASIRRGHDGMPPVADGVGTADIHGLTAFVRLLSTSHADYQVVCARCHGARGVPPPGADPSIPPFDRGYFAAHDPDSVRRKIWHMLGKRPPVLMPHFRGVLTDVQARAIVDYLRSLPAE